MTVEEAAHDILDRVIAGFLQIVDGPRFTWRGALLDVGRHYFSVPFILKFLDSLALHKINKFHWHLTEDQVRLPADNAALSAYFLILQACSSHEGALRGQNIPLSRVVESCRCMV